MSFAGKNHVCELMGKNTRLFEGRNANKLYPQPGLKREKERETIRNKRNPNCLLIFFCFISNFRLGDAITYLNAKRRAQREGAV